MNTASRIGLSWRPQTDGLLDEAGDAAPLSFCEAHIEGLLGRREAIDRLRERRRSGLAVHLHSTNLHLLADGFLEDPAEVDAVAALAEAVDAELISTHLASGEFYVGPVRSFGRPAYTARTLDETLRRLELARTRLGRVMAAENVACYGAPIDDEIDEIAFMTQLGEQGAPLIFDLSNHLTNRINRTAACGDLDAFEGQGVRYVHISGGKWLDQTYVDTHGDAIPYAHMDALVELRRKIGPLRVLYERDIRYDRREEILSDLGRVWQAIRS